MFPKTWLLLRGANAFASSSAVRARPPIRPDEARLSGLQPGRCGPVSPRRRRGRGRGGGRTSPIALQRQPEDPAALPSHPALSVSAPPLPQDKIGLCVRDDGHTVVKEWGPTARRSLREPLAASAQPPATPRLRSAAGSPLPKHPSLPVSPCATIVPAGQFLASHTTPLSDGLRQRSRCGTHPTGGTAGLRDGGRPPASLFLSAVHLANKEEPPVWIWGSGTSQSISTGK